MDSARFAKLQDLFDRLCDLLPAEQQACIAVETDGDPELRAELDRLLAMHAAPEAHLPTPGAPRDRIAPHDTLDRSSPPPGWPDPRRAAVREFWKRRRDGVSESTAERLLRNQANDIAEPLSCPLADPSGPAHRARAEEVAHSEFLDNSGLACEVVDELMRELDRALPDDTEEAADFGRYWLLRHLGSGGMGTVHLALDTQLHREVALKRIRRELLLSAEARRRFELETRLASRLDHPHVCKVLDAGEHEGQPYLVMPYLRGETLAARFIAAQGRTADAASQHDSESAAAAPLDPTDCLRWAEQIGYALQHAHDRGLIHRDVKPSNILIDEHGDAILLDFGLARSPGDSTALTVAGAVPGTFPYMSPEQLDGSGRDLDGRTDVFSLGVVLAEALLGQHPFAAATDIEIIQQIRAGNPQLARSADRPLDHDVATVLKRAMARDREFRYPTAAALASDLARIRRHEPTVAGAPQRMRSGRRRAALLLLAGLGVGLAIATAAWALPWAAADAARNRAETVASTLQAVLDTTGDADPVAALRCAVAAAATTGRPEFDTLLWQRLDRCGLAWSSPRVLTAGRPPTVRTAYESEIWVDAQASPTETCVAMISSYGLLRVVDARDGEIVHECQATPIGVALDGNSLLEFDATGQRMFVASRGGLLKVFRTSDWVEIGTTRVSSGGAELLSGDDLLAVRIGPDDNTVAIGTSHGQLVLLQLDTGAQSCIELHPALSCTELQFNRSGRRLLVGLTARGGFPMPIGQLWVVDLLTHASRRLAQFDHGHAFSCCWHPDGHWVAAATSGQGELLALEVDGSGRREILARCGPLDTPPFVRWCGFDTTGTHLVAGMAPGLRVFDWHDGAVEPTRTIAHPHGRTAAAAQFSEDGRALAALFADGSLGLVDTSTWQLRRHVAHRALATCRTSVTWLSRAQRILTGHGTEICAWQPPGGNPTLDALHSAEITSVDTHPMHSVVLAASMDGSISLSDPASGSIRRIELGAPQLDARWSDDGRHFFTLGGGTVQLFDADCLEPQHRIAGTLARFAGDRHLLVAVDQTARLLDLESGTQRPLGELAGPVLSACYDPEQQCVFFGGADHIVHQAFLGPDRGDQTVDTGAVSVGPGSRLGYVNYLAHAPGIDRMLVSCVNSLLLLVDSRTTRRPVIFESSRGRFGGPIAIDPLHRGIALADYSFGRLTWAQPRTDGQFEWTEMDLHTQQITALRFSRSGAALLSASLDGTVRVWDPETRSLVRTLRLPNPVRDACFTADDRWIVTGSADGRVEHWPTDPLPAAQRYLDELDRRCRSTR